MGKLCGRSASTVLEDRLDRRRTWRRRGWDAGSLLHDNVVGSTPSTVVWRVFLCARWAQIAVRAGRHHAPSNTTETPGSTTSWAAHLATARPIPVCLRPTGRNPPSLPARYDGEGSCLYT